MSTVTKVSFPATKSFVAQLLAACKSMGLHPVSLDSSTESGLKENAGWCFLRFEGTHESGASLIIPKAVTKLGRLHSHVDLAGQDGFVPLSKPNGKVVCHFEPDIEKVKKVLSRFLSASKRATLSPTPRAKVVASAPASQPVDGQAEVDSWTTVVPTPVLTEDEELEALMAAELNG